MRNDISFTGSSKPAGPVTSVIWESVRRTDPRSCTQKRSRILCGQVIRAPSGRVTSVSQCFRASKAIQYLSRGMVPKPLDH